MEYALSELGWSIMIDHVRLCQSEFTLLRSLARERWNGRDAVLWKSNRTWLRLSDERHLSEARSVIKILERRGLIEHVDISQIEGSHMPKRFQGFFQLSLRGRGFLISANNPFVFTPPSRLSLLSRIAKAFSF